MQKGTKRNLFVAATYAAVLFLGILLGQNYVVDSRQVQPPTPILPIGPQNNENNVQRALELISGNYVDSINVDSLQHLILSEMVSRLDPHSDYLAPEEAARREQALEGTFEGIGVEYFMLNDTVLAVGLVPDGPAQEAGLKVGDRMLAIDGYGIAGVQISTQDLEKRIRGQRGSVLEVSVHRQGQDLPLPLKITRDRYEISSIDVAYLLAPGIAYIRISNFGSRTVEDCKRHLQALRKQGAKEVILDLRGNGGGYLSAGIDLAGLFFRTGRPIVFTEGTHEPKKVYAAREGGQFTDMGLVMLIDEESASASEIVAGAIQDYERGTIIGRRSYGKGLIQERFGFGDGSVLNLTVARYYTPLGRSIQRSNQAAPNRITEVLKADSTADSIKSKPPFVTASGKPLFAGGGIMPDIIVEMDSTEFSPFYQQIFQKGLLHEFVYGRLVTGVPGFAIENFLNGYALPEAEFQDFIQFVEEKGIEFTEQDDSPVKQRMSLEIEALLGRYYFGSDAYFKVKNRQDQVIHAALTHLEVKKAVNRVP